MMKTATLLLVGAINLGLGCFQEVWGTSGCANSDPDGTSSPPTPCPNAGNSPQGEPSHFHAYSGNSNRELVDLALFSHIGEHTLAWTRFSNTRYTNGQQPFGNAGNYRHSYQWEMVDAGLNSSGQAQLDVYHPDGKVNRFTQVSASQWNSAPSVPDVIYQNGESFSLQDSAGWRWNFARLSDSTGQYYLLQSFTDTTQNTVTLSYNAAHQLLSVSDAAGRSLQISYASLPITKVDFTQVAAVAGTPPAGEFLGTRRELRN